MFDILLLNEVYTDGRNSLVTSIQEISTKSGQQRLVHKVRSLKKTTETA